MRPVRSWREPPVTGLDNLPADRQFRAVDELDRHADGLGAVVLVNVHCDQRSIPVAWSFPRLNACDIAHRSDQSRQGLASSVIVIVIDSGNHRFLWNCMFPLPRGYHHRFLVGSCLPRKRLVSAVSLPGML
jgi:hypothetical protein